LKGTKSILIEFIDSLIEDIQMEEYYFAIVKLKRLKKIIKKER
jgi:predicted DNA-binding protein